MEELLGTVGQTLAPVLAIGTAAVFVAIIALIFYTTLLEGRAEKARHAKDGL